MDLTYNAADQAFREEVRHFIEEHYPPARRNNPSPQDTEHWRQAVYQQGWACASWPERWGGIGWSPVRQYIWDKETASAECPAVELIGIKLLAPVLMCWGSEQQNETFLPGILSGKDHWCLGITESGAGSDLRAIETSAVLQGHHYELTGVKTWVTDAHLADWMVCLAKIPDPGTKADRRSIFLVNMRSRGISTNPFRSISGQERASTVTLHHVHVPVANRLGEESDGPGIAAEIRALEATELINIADASAALNRLKAVSANLRSAGVMGANQDSAFNTRLLGLDVQLQALEGMELRLLHERSTSQSLSPLHALLKIRSAEIIQRLTELAMQAAAYYTLPFETEAPGSNEPMIGPEYSRNTTLNYLIHRGNSLQGGSTEMQKNDIARSILGFEDGSPR